MKRSDEIKEAAFKMGMEWIDIDRFQEECFIAGAEWADENSVNSETSDYYYIRKDVYYELEAELQNAKYMFQTLKYANEAYARELAIRDKAITDLGRRLDKQCAHPKDKVICHGSRTRSDGNGLDTEYSCECGAIVVPEGFKEV